MGHYLNTVRVHHPLGMLTYLFVPAVAVLVVVLTFGQRPIPRWLRQLHRGLWATTGLGVVMAVVGEMACSGLLREEHACMTGMKELGLGVIQYTQDWDERYPPAARWRETVAATQGPRIMRYACRSYGGPWAYAMNGRLGAVSMSTSTFMPASTVMLAEHPARSPNETTTALVTSGFRHRGVMNVAFAGGHVKRVSRLNQGDLVWAP